MTTTSHKKRSYKQNCALAHTADMITERWTLLILRELLLSPRKYNQLLTNLKGIGTNLLATRLKELTVEKIIEQTNTHRYQLTEQGQLLEPTILGLIRWGLSFTKDRSDPTYLHQPEWDLLAMKALFNPEHILKRPLTLQVKTSDLVAWITISTGRFEHCFEKSNKTVDIHWNAPIAELASEKKLSAVDQEDKARLKDFLSAFVRHEQL